MLYVQVWVTASTPVADPGGGGGPGGPDPPPFGPRCRLFNIGPKVGPPFFACRPKMDPSVGSRVCVCVWQGWSPPPPLGMWMTSHGQCPRGVCACECPRVGVFFNFSEGGWRHADNVQGGGGACEKSCIRAWTPPPLSKILDPRLYPSLHRQQPETRCLSRLNQVKQVH